MARLQAAGLDRGLATEVVAALPPGVRRDPPQRLILEVLASRLAPLGAGDEALAGIDVFVGPPGAGKTTTIAKLAAQLRAKTGLKPTLVAADGYRVGAVEQLRLYADILGLPFVVARTAADLDRALATAGRPMLVDTAGRSPSDRGVRDLFDALSGRPGVRTHLVIAAGTSARDAERVFETYQAARPARVVLSKVDETESVSALVGLLRARQQRVSWIGCGQRVPEDLVAASGETLAAVMLGELRQPRRQQAAGVGGGPVRIGTKVEERTDRDQLVLEHVGLVKALAQRLVQRLPAQVEVNDLISVGVLGSDRRRHPLQGIHRRAV